MTATTYRERNYSLDVIKIISCALVVLMHSLRAFDKSVELHPYLYYFTRCSMPLFFMVAGAVQLQKACIDFQYCYRKIKSIVLLMIAYYGCDFFLRIVNSFDFSFAALLNTTKHCYWDFGVFWFLYSMIIIYMVLPWLHKRYKRHPYLLLSIFGIFIIAHNLYNIVNIQFNGAGQFVETIVLQPLRVWTWLFYYLMGGVIFKSYKIIRLSKKLQWTIAIITTLCAIYYMYWMFFVTTNIINGEYAYTSLTVILWSISLMITFLNTNFCKYKTAINRMAKMLIPVYALHYTVIHQIVLPLDVFSGYWEQLAGYVTIFLITSILAYTITKISFMKVFYKI